MGIAGMALLALLACAAPAQPPSPTAQPNVTPTPLLDEFHAEMIAMRTLWRRQNMPNYRIRFEFIEDATRPQVTSREVFVANFSVRSARCSIGACPTSIFRDINTVSDVFAFMERISESCIVQVTYNRHLHYPALVSADCAEGISHPFVLRIREVGLSG